MKTYTEHIFEELIDNSTEDKVRRYLERKRREAEERKMNMVHPKNKKELQDEILKAIIDKGSNVDLNYIDVSEIDDMSYLFEEYDEDGETDESEKLRSFNGDISGWDVSGVENMARMFAKSCFNGNISYWDVSSVKDMSGMFFHAESFNQPIGDWDVSNVMDMDSMFLHATNFDQDLSGWNKKMGKVEDIRWMFCEATSFNHDISGWELDSVSGDFQGVFENATNFNKPMNNWKVNIGGSTCLNYMFYGATKFNQPLNEWDVTSVHYMEHMFNGATSFDQDLSGWNTENVTHNVDMFKNCHIKEENKPNFNKNVYSGDKK